MAHFNFNYIFISMTAVCYSFPICGKFDKSKNNFSFISCHHHVLWAQHNGRNVIGADYKYIFMVRLPLTEE